jgi:DNA mismatch repair ATPase MutS
MRIKKNGKVIRLTESDLKKIVKRVLTEETINEQWYKDAWESLKRDANYIGRDLKKAVAEIPDIPGSFKKLADKLTDGKEWEQVAAGFKEMGKTLGIVDEQDEQEGSWKDKLKKIIGNSTYEKIAKLAKAATKM